MGREWRTIREELDRALLRKHELPKVQDLAIDAIAIIRDAGGRYSCWSPMRSGPPNIADCPRTWRIVQKIPGQRKPATMGAAIPHRRISSVVGHYQKRKFKPTPITLALVL